MEDFTRIKFGDITDNTDRIELENLSLKKSNSILFGIIAVAILVFIGAYIRTHEDENDR